MQNYFRNECHRTNKQQQIAVTNPGEVQESDFQSCLVILFKMSSAQYEIYNHAKKQVSMSNTQEKQQSTETVPEEAQTLALPLDNDLNQVL